MVYWIFQGNPDRFDIDLYLSSQQDIYWSVTRASHQSTVSVGDIVFIWRARGKSNSKPGIVGVGHITEAPRPISEIADKERLAENLWQIPEDDPADMKAGIHMDEVRLTMVEGMIGLQDIMLDENLQDMNIVKVRTGTNFPISYEQFELLRSLWGAGSKASTEEVFGEYEAREGRVRLAVHKKRERDPRLSSEAKQAFKKEHGSLFCEICGFSFGATYGEMGEDYIESHHKLPLSKLEEDVVTRIGDLMMVCSNCHRMIHKGGPHDNLSQLKQIFHQCD